MNRATAEWIDRARDVDIGDVILKRGIKLRGRGQQYWGPCPHCGGKDRFGIHVGKQLFNCRGCGGGGHGAISFVMWFDGCDFMQAVASITGAPAPTRRVATPDLEAQRRAADHYRRQQAQRKQDEADEAERLARADAIWREAKPIADTAGEAYLLNRGIVLDEVPDRGALRYHPFCPFDGGLQACIVARYTKTLTGVPLGIHRRPIHLVGTTPKAFGSTIGGVIRLWPDEDVSTGLVIGEGVETVLAAATRIEHRNTLLRPAWACGSAGAIATFPVLAGIEALTILADADAPDGRGRHPGQDAAATCAKRWSDAGREVTILTPRALGLDFNDLVR
jgi:phage/plasmid primase-like uncharacterized protein